MPDCFDMNELDEVMKEAIETECSGKEDDCIITIGDVVARLEEQICHDCLDAILERSGKCCLHTLVDELIRMAKLTHSYEYDDFSVRNDLVIRKSRGRLTLGEITDYLLHEARLYGQYAILLNCTEGTCEPQSPFDDDNPPGDVVVLHEIVDQESCPVCGGFVPMKHCPMCGAELEG